ncbi:MAG: hypothetical protein ABW167_19625 [Baekduia sp.]
MAGLVFVGAIVVALVLFVVLPELSRRRHLRKVKSAPPAKILRPPGHRTWRDNGDDYDRMWR